MNKYSRSLLVAKIVLLLMVLMMVVNLFIFRFADWATRTVGVVLLADLIAVSYLTVRQIKSE